MQDLARGWTIVMAHWHGHDLADMIAIWIALMPSVWLPVWIALRVRKKGDTEDETLRPKQRTKLPGPDRGFRR